MIAVLAQLEQLQQLAQSPRRFPVD